MAVSRELAQGLISSEEALKRTVELNKQAQHLKQESDEIMALFGGNQFQIHNYDAKGRMYPDSEFISDPDK